MIVKNISEIEAKEISLWKYQGEYSVYNYPSWEMMCEQKWAITIDDVREKEYFGLYNISNILIGNFRLHNTGDFIKTPRENLFLFRKRGNRGNLFSFQFLAIQYTA